MDQPPPAPAPNRLERYKIIRDEIVHEDNLIGVRLSWFTASQAFLFSALAIAQGSQRGLPNQHNNYFFPMLPIVALISNVLIFSGVMAGVMVLRYWRRMFDEKCGGEFADLPRIPRDGWIISFGWAAPIGLPIVFLVAWTYLLVAGWAP